MFGSMYETKTTEQTLTPQVWEIWDRNYDYQQGTRWTPPRGQRMEELMKGMEGSA